MVKDISELCSGTLLDESGEYTCDCLDKRRQRELVASGSPETLDGHGTRRMYQFELREEKEGRGKGPCPACTEANRLYQISYRRGNLQKSTNEKENS